MSKEVTYQLSEWVIVKASKNFHQFNIGEEVQIYRINSHGFICKNEHGDMWALTDAEIMKSF